MELRMTQKQFRRLLGQKTQRNRDQGDHRPCLEGNRNFRVHLFRQFSEFPAGGGHVGEEFLGGVESRIDGTGQRAGGFNIAFPVVADDNSAFTPFVSEFQEFILPGGVDFRGQKP